MGAALIKGQNGALDVARVLVSVRTEAPVDVSALLVTEAGRVRSDADFVFFNQPSAPGVTLDQGTPAALSVSLSDLPADIAQLRAVLTLDDPAQTFGRFAPPVATVADAAGNVLYEYRVEGLGSESVVIALELYRRQGVWKVRAVGQGYAGGFAALVTDHGVSVDDEPVRGEAPSAHPAAPDPQAMVIPTADVFTVPGEAKLSFDKRAKLDLRKRAVAKVLIDKDAFGIRARVVLVIDKTGSMKRQYHDKVVHRVVQRMIPVATQLDDDGTLEAYLYALSFAKLPDITVEHGDEWTRTFLHLTGTHAGIDYDRLGGRNDELPIMRDVIDSLRPGGRPTLVLFFTDGGFAKKREIAALMREASQLPAFWQFVGLGRANYGLLRTLDELSDRAVDNAGFFALDDIDQVDDGQLYARLLGEFPDWLRAARTAGILR
ncbi:VWA domain-containing protein [Nocardia abscessus]|uniref:vWA domain-containing protein n=1 Tax=Nocardia TaxID=1817 RepID=UPI001895B8A9|nr:MULTISPECIES: VWA domain-containing protein [Nocardia]MBF6219347.1 VWA domain-containing protein [Nocardia abscessus]MDE1669241.1 VWA domain-containing protein [Nocardia gipuzkoensis]